MKAPKIIVTSSCIEIYGLLTLKNLHNILTAIYSLNPEYADRIVRTGLIEPEERQLFEAMGLNKQCETQFQSTN